MSILQISTSRTFLKPLAQNDWALFQQLNSDPQITALCFDPPSKAELKQKFDTRLIEWTPECNQWLCLVIYQKLTMQPIGITGFVLQEGKAEVGYLLLPEFYGQQYATESLSAVIDWAHDTHYIEHFSATVTEGNIASERVLEKCGFVLKETIPDAYEIGGKLYADKIYARQNNQPQ